MIELSCAHHFDFHSPEYRRLFDRSSATAFQHPHWLTSFYRHLAHSPTTRGLIVLGRSSDTGELQLLLPLMKRSEGQLVTVEFAHADVTDYACPVVHSDLQSAPERLAEVRGQLTQAVGSRARWRVDPVREMDREIWARILWISPARLDFGSHEINPQHPFRAWRDGNLGSARRAQLDRKIRRLFGRGHCALEVLSAADAKEAIVWARKTRRGRFTDDPIQRTEAFHFYREVAADGAVDGFSRTYRLRCGDDTVAVCFGVTDRGRFCYLLLACDYRRYGRYSPGTIILDLAMSDWVGNGGTTFDFTIGDEPYKADFRCTRSDLFRFAGRTPSSPSGEH